MKKYMPYIVTASMVLIGILILVYLRMQTAKEEKVQQFTVNKQVVLPTPTPAIDAVGAVESTLALTVSVPQDKAVVKTNSIVVKGKTVPKAEVFVNDKEQIADASGNFSVSIPLDEGENPILIVANDSDGNAAEKEISVTYEVNE